MVSADILVASPSSLSHVAALVGNMTTMYCGSGFKVSPGVVKRGHQARALGWVVVDNCQESFELAKEIGTKKSFRFKVSDRINVERRQRQRQVAFQNSL